MALTKVTGNVVKDSSISGSKIITDTTIQLANITASGNISASGNLYGTIATAGQTNITSVGTIGTGVWNSTFGSTANTLISGSVNAANISGSLGTNATLIRSLTAANISGSFTTTSSSLASKVTTLEGTGTAQGVGTTNSPTFADVTATGTVTAQEFHTEFISASVIYDSGSTRFGDTTDDTHAFTGSLTTSGSSLKIDSAGTYSGSSTSTGSYGRVEATNYSGDGSALTGIDIPTAAVISGSFEGGGSTNISGSSTSTGSFGSTHVMGNLNIGTTSSNSSASVVLGSSDASVTVSGSIFPEGDNNHDLGSANYRWRYIYTTDLKLSNEGTGGNSVDGTEGNWTVEEGEEDLFVTNKKSGKKFRIKLEEIE